MDKLRDLREIATYMRDRYGAEAASMMDGRAALHERDGEPEMATFWACVAQAIRGLRPDCSSSRRPGSGSHGPMAGRRRSPAKQPAAL
jgi:hypothetical protein